MHVLPDYIVASLTPFPVVWAFADTHDAAAEIAEGITPLEDRRYAPMTYAAYLDAERAHYLGQPLQEVSAAMFLQRRDLCGYPLAWEFRDGVERFTAPEPMHAPFHRQYARLEDRHVTRLVDIGDRKTWVGADEVRAHLAAASSRAERIGQRPSGRAL